MAIAVCLPVLMLGLVRHPGLSLTIDQPEKARGPGQAGFKSSADETARQVTMFAILATAGPPTVDSRLGSIRTQLRKALPGHGFRLIDVESKRIEAHQSVTCDLGHGYKAETILVLPFDEAGKVHLRCVLSKDGPRSFQPWSSRRSTSSSFTNARWPTGPR